MRCSTWLTWLSSARSQLTIQHALTRTRPALGVPAILSEIPTPGPKRMKRPFSRGIAPLEPPRRDFGLRVVLRGQQLGAMAIAPGDPVENVIVCQAAAAELDPDEARAHTEGPDQLRAHAVSAGGDGWLAGEAFPAAELLKPEALLQREGLAAHLPAQFVELLPFLGGDCPLDGLAARWLGFGHRPVKPSRPPHNPHLLQGIGVS